MTYPVNPPPYSPTWHPEPSAPPMPSAPPYPYAFNNQNHAFFGDTSSDQNQLSRDMLTALVVNKTNWVNTAKVPADSLTSRILNWFKGTSALPTKLPVEGELLEKDKSKLYLHAARLIYAEYTNDHAQTKEMEQLRKSNQVFHDFVEDLASDERNADYCLRAAEDFSPQNPEIFFEHGKLYFLQQDYTKAVNEFRLAAEHSPSLDNSSKAKQSAFKALTLSCAAAANERLGFHDLALFDYIDAAKIDPNGSEAYDEARLRNFQILKFKTNKTFAELQACIEHDPCDPEFPVELSHAYIDRGEYGNATELLKRSLSLSLAYKPSTLYRCADAAQRLALSVNTTLPAHGPY